MFNEQNEIRGDDIEDVREVHPRPTDGGSTCEELERIAGYEEGPEPQHPTDEDAEAYANDWQARMGIDDPEPMGSFDSSDDAEALASAGMGTDEDYGYFGGEDAFLDGSYEE